MNHGTQSTSIPVTYQRPGARPIQGHVVGASPVSLGVLILRTADGKTISVDGDHITKRIGG